MGLWGKFIDRGENCVYDEQKLLGELILLIFMSRSLKKGPYVDLKLQKKVEGKKAGDAGVIKTWARGSQISPEMVGFTFGVHNGREHIEVRVSEEMVGHYFGEFSPTKKFIRHGGKMQRDLEQKKKDSEIAAAKAAKTADTKK
jgi:small subunit ribosomal protein S19